MTITPHGYADWQKVESRTDQVYINDSARSTAGTVAYPLFFCGNTEALQINLDGNSGSGECRLFFFADQAQTILVGEVKLGVGVAQDLYRTVYPLGPWCVVNVVVGPASPFVYNLIVHTAAGLAFANAFYDRVVIHSEIVTAIAAGTATTFDFLNSYIGTATWTARVNGTTNWAASVQSIDNGGVTRYLARSTGQNPYQGGVIHLIGGRIQGTIFNADAAPHDYDFIVVAHPLGQ